MSGIWREQQTIVGEGLCLHWRDYAGAREQTPVVCLPGLTRNGRDFESLAVHLAKFLGRRVLCLDLRGRGRSDHDPDWRNYRLDVYVQDVLTIMDRVELDRAIIIGTSLGGLVGMHLAAIPQVRAAARVAGLVLNDIGPELEAAGMLRIATGVGTARAAASWAEAAADARLTHAAVMPDFTEADWLTFAKRVYRDDGTGQLVRDMDPNIGRAMRESGSEVPDFWAVFSTLKELPMLCLRGELSDLLSAATVERMVTLHPGLQTCMVPRRGHSPTLDEPASRAAIDAFVRPL